MATVSQRHPGGRPRIHPPSDLYLRVERLAKKRGLRIDELAAAAGVGRATFYRLHDPRVSTVAAIADALGISVDALIGRKPAARAARRPA